ncbi:putative aminodeoxychorismate lyase [Escherichia coli]|nr:putative aminodeoxychorismate lyase [Escherichia coli]
MANFLVQTWKRPTAYNTYTITGLPPGAIATAGGGFAEGCCASGKNAVSLFCGRW